MFTDRFMLTLCTFVYYVDFTNAMDISLSKTATTGTDMKTHFSFDNSKYVSELVKSGSHIIQSKSEHGSGYDLLLDEATSNSNSKLQIVKNQEKTVTSSNSSDTDLSRDDWFVYYYVDGSTFDEYGYYSFETKLTVPSEPTVESNLSIFTGLTSSFSIKNYDWILQPVLKYTENGWTMAATMCPVVYQQFHSKHSQEIPLLHLLI